MIVLLNLVPVFVLGAGLFAAWKLKKAWPAVVGVVAVMLYVQFQPSYMPKGEVKRTEIPAFEQSDAEIENRNLSPKAGNEYDQERNDSIEKGLPFIDKKVDTRS